MAANAEPAYARSPQAVVSDLGSDIERGLSEAEVAQRQSTYGLNEIAAEKPPSMVAVALGQLRDPMNIMLVAVTVVSFADRSGLHRRHRRPADPAQRGARDRGRS